MGAYTIVYRDECERAGDWSRVRRSLGLESFGMSLVELPRTPASPSKTRSNRDQEDVFFVVSGRATVVVDGEEIEAPEGTFLGVDGWRGARSATRAPSR